MSGPDYVRVTARLVCGLRCGSIVLPHELPDLNDFGCMDETNRLVKQGLLVGDDVSIEGYTVGTMMATEDNFAQTDMVVNIRFDLSVHPDWVNVVIGQIRGQASGLDPDAGEGDAFGPLVFDMVLVDGLFEWSIWQGPSVCEMQVEGKTV